MAIERTSCIGTFLPSIYNRNVFKAKKKCVCARERERESNLVLKIYRQCTGKLYRLVGCFALNGPLRQYFSLYRAVSQREGES